MNSMERQKYMALNNELPRSVGAQYATGDQWRNNCRNNEETEPKGGVQCPVVDMLVMEAKSNVIKSNIA